MLLFHSIFLAPEQFAQRDVINKVFFGCLHSVLPQNIGRADHLPRPGQRLGYFGRTCLSWKLAGRLWTWFGSGWKPSPASQTIPLRVRTLLLLLAARRSPCSAPRSRQLELKGCGAGAETVGSLAAGAHPSRPSRRGRRQPAEARGVLSEAGQFTYILLFYPCLFIPLSKVDLGV